MPQDFHHRLPGAARDWFHRLPGAARGFRRGLLATLAVLAVAVPAFPQEAGDEAAGLNIATEADARGKGFGNYTASLSMVLRNRQGQESRRELRFKSMEVEGDGDMSLFVFDEPRDVAGTAMLVHGHVDAADDQWLYLPALGRVRRINSSNRSGSFMGSEFSYEDMSPPQVEKFTYRHLRDEPCGELVCTVIERFPTEDQSAYLRQLVWHDKDEFRVWKVEYYDRRDSHLKTLTLDGHRQYLDRFWRAGELTMVNHQSGKSTVLAWSDFQFQTGIDEAEFTQTGLRRAR